MLLFLSLPEIDTSRRLSDTTTRETAVTRDDPTSLRCPFRKIASRRRVASFLSFFIFFPPLALLLYTFRSAESRAIIAPLTVHWHGRKRDARRGKLDTGHDRAIKPIYVRISFRARTHACVRRGPGAGDRAILSPSLSLPPPRTCRRSWSLRLRASSFFFSPRFPAIRRRSQRIQRNCVYDFYRTIRYDAMRHDTSRSRARARES